MNLLDYSHLIKITISLLAIVNPIGCLPIFITATEGWTGQDREKTARLVAFTVFIVLTLSAFIGNAILAFFGISIASFQVGGGILILLIAISMMHGKTSGTRQTPEEAQSLAERDAIAIVPLSIPLLAGPGAISSMIISADQHPGFWGHVSLILPAIVVSITIWTIFQLAESITVKLDTIGINIVTRLMGLILAAMAIEFIAKGMIGLFPHLGN